MVKRNKTKGIVVRFDRRKGFGFIQPKKAGEKQVFVHWSEIVSDETWPVLQNGAEVEFVLNEKDDKGKRSAEKVSKVGGGKIKNKEDDRDIDEETIYTGTVKFFDGRKGFGFITPDEEIEYSGQTASNDDEGGVYVAREDIITAEDSGASLNDGTKVQFQVYKGKKALGACRVQNEDGTPYEYVPYSNKRKGSNKTGKNKRAKTEA